MLEFLFAMPIPEGQLERWSHQGAVVSSQTTHTSVRNALYAETSPIKNANFEVYLQGSYRNGTNIRADSDVDVVVQLNRTFGHNALFLPPDQYGAFLTSYPTTATYNWPDFRRDVLHALTSYFGRGTVSEGTKCLRVAAESGRLTADVIPALLYKGYWYFYNANAESYLEGIEFRDRAGRTIVNYPKAHFENGVSKNSDEHTAGWFKPTVRMIKNARNCAVERMLLADGVAPSYFVDCLLWNVPDNHFGPTFVETYCGAVNFLNRADLSNFMCTNGILPLFGNSQEQWSQVSARTLLRALTLLWQNW